MSCRSRQAARSELRTRLLVGDLAPCPERLRLEPGGSLANESVGTDTPSDGPPAEYGVSFITTGVEYGLHCLVYLVGAPHGAREASVGDLAELQGVPAGFLAKVFTKLRRAGLVHASEGVRGGFSLARSAGSISVLDVVEAIDGNRALFECNEIRGRCAMFGGRPPRWAATGTCSIHAVMIEAEKRMRKSLAERSLADLADAIAHKARSGYGDDVRAWLGDRAEQKVRHKPE